MQNFLVYNKTTSCTRTSCNFGWGTVIRTQECRSQSLYKCFIYFVIYYYIIPLKKALSQAFSPY